MPIVYVSLNSAVTLWRHFSSFIEGLHLVDSIVGIEDALKRFPVPWTCKAWNA